MSILDRFRGSGMPRRIDEEPDPTFGPDDDWDRKLDAEARRQLEVVLIKQWEMEKARLSILSPARAVLRIAAAVYEEGHTTPSLSYLDWVMKPHDAIDARANLEEAYAKWVERGGYKRADRLMRWQGLRMAIGYMIDRVTSRLGQFAQLFNFGS